MWYGKANDYTNKIHVKNLVGDKTYSLFVDS